MLPPGILLFWLLVPAVFFILGCSVFNPDDGDPLSPGNSNDEITQREDVDDMTATQHPLSEERTGEKIPAFDRNVPAGLVTATLAMG